MFIYVKDVDGAKEMLGGSGTTVLKDPLDGCSQTGKVYIHHATRVAGGSSLFRHVRHD